MFKESIKILNETINLINHKLEICRRYDLREKSAQLETLRIRASLAIDLLEGKAFCIYQEEKSGELVLVRPSEAMGKLLKVAEEHGGRITAIEELKEDKGEQ